MRQVTRLEEQMSIQSIPVLQIFAEWHWSLSSASVQLLQRPAQENNPSCQTDSACGHSWAAFSQTLGIYRYLDEPDWALVQQVLSLFRTRTKWTWIFPLMKGGSKSLWRWKACYENSFILIKNVLLASTTTSVLTCLQLIGHKALSTDLSFPSLFSICTSRCQNKSFNAVIRTALSLNPS